MTKSSPPYFGPSGERVLVSVVIPALNEVESICRTIDAARRSYTADKVEIIVVDGGSTDGTPDLVPPKVTLLKGPRGRAAQMNAGARVSHGEILVFCHADSRLPEGWREPVIETLNKPGVSGGSFQMQMLPAKGILHLRNRLTMPNGWLWIYGDQCQFMRRATFEKVGGFAEIVLMEDVEMSRSLHQAGQLVRIASPRVITSSRRFVERGVLKQITGNLWRMCRYLFMGATPEQIAQSYRSSREKPLDNKTT